MQAPFSLKSLRQAIDIRVSMQQHTADKQQITNSKRQFSTADNLMTRKMKGHCQSAHCLPKNEGYQYIKINKWSITKKGKTSE